MALFEFDLANLSDANEAPVRRLVKVVLLIAIRDRAAVIRFQQEDRSFRMFEKVNGVFLEMVPPPPHLRKNIVNLFRVIAHLDHATVPRPSRGFGHGRLGDYVIHLFVNIVPGSFGEMADVSLIYSPDLPAEASRELEAYRRTGENADEIVFELAEEIHGEWESEFDKQDYFLRS